MDDFGNSFRNFVLAVFLGAVLLLLSLYISGIILTFLEYKQLTEDFALSIKPIETLIELVEFWIINYSTIDLQYDNYFVARVIGSILGPLVIIGWCTFHYKSAIYALRPYKKKEAVHGDARWATEEDIKKARLRVKKGMLLGRDSKGFLVADGYQHTLLFAPTGSGKGVGFVIPNLLYWEDSVVVHDIKLENYELTSGWRKKMG
ncbi:Type IV secretion system protein VirD4 N-terminal domain [Candidatus Bandiella woodruffii]|uniref:Type IV secretion system protein VirD4 N-terminal domain n=1 Tax=Candidatus Bandiella euplotis TaxID=1664265 RepID=A0ABZ0UNE7_9RICK|nr:Type IV secretion system protein VirD4 N-terminal domain [Candidatus Bandiella woodruffii]